MFPASEAWRMDGAVFPEANPSNVVPRAPEFKTKPLPSHWCQLDLAQPLSVEILNMHIGMGKPGLTALRAHCTQQQKKVLGTMRGWVGLCLLQHILLAIFLYLVPMS